MLKELGIKTPEILDRMAPEEELYRKLAVGKPDDSGFEEAKKDLDLPTLETIGKLRVWLLEELKNRPSNREPATVS